MKHRHSSRRLAPLLCLTILLLLWLPASGVTDAGDLQVLQNFLKGVKNPSALGWSGNDPCGSKWAHMRCEGSSVAAIFASGLNLQGTVTSGLNALTNLQSLQLQNNGFTGSLPSLKGLASLTDAYFGGNSFDIIPGDFFSGLTSLQHLYLDDNPLNGTNGWSLPFDIQGSTQLNTLSLTNISLTGTIPDFLGKMSNLRVLNVAYNRLGGSLPASFSSSNLVQFQANNQQGPVLSGRIDVVGGMQSLAQLWLQVNGFTGPIPAGLTNAISLKDLRLNDNALEGIIPPGLVNLPLGNFTVKNNQLVGPIPKFPSNVNFVYSGNNFCQATPGVGCDPQVMGLLGFLDGVNYPSVLVSSWIGNDPCGGWIGVTCASTTKGNAGTVSDLVLVNDKLNGTISPALGNLTGLTTLKLNDNNLTGTIPTSLTKLPLLKTVDLSNNNLSKPVPVFPPQVALNTTGNPLNDVPSGPSAAPGGGSPTPVPGTSSGGSGSSPLPTPTNSTSGGSTKSSSVSVGGIVGALVGAISIVLLIAVGCLVYRRRRSRFIRIQGPNTVVVHPGDSGRDPEVVKIVVAGNGTNGNTSQSHSRSNSGPSEVQVVEAGNLLISIQVLRNATKNFSEQTILGRGGFGVVYRGELDDGTNIAVKRMEAAVVSNKGSKEFQAEIAVLTKVRHRHLVALLGYCIEGNERLLVYEYMPQGTLSQHLFEYESLGLKPLSWKQRLSIALDVARGMEYLHGLAHKSFIHRDLKPSNILLGDDFRAKVSDFGLVKLAPDGKLSVETRLAGTFGYLAPEYAVTGRVTTKADVFSFGVVLMELITGRRAIDDTQSEENMHLVTWFRRMSANKESFRTSIDTAIELTEETYASISITAELAGHCTAREPYQRPDMGHAVNVLAPMVEQWKPSDFENEESAGIDLDMTLPQALKRWQALENSSTSFLDDTHTSIPTRPTGFADSFASTDGR
ncbi:hypothetical protein O6H91_20G062300 [Diphasiastrum complanatum]|uniref:Uncharacterized protein n=3 Tax=Diphasiastrum complanatum TaxID=34168 RepID=A0ACC2AR45_DIPCM|nr:hypothetical protein O6H91_20G047100 [Diphasiastrum complanatum]KAJ7519628.1 hypothetical protein O6H91_20G047100 [Diphasiastrum complanatum]KAJ7519983.1 hypothetical protein O6H91_20G062300 [Diphasiastrum complanatum]